MAVVPCPVPRAPCPVPAPPRFTAAELAAEVGLANVMDDDMLRGHGAWASFIKRLNAHAYNDIVILKFRTLFNGSD